MSNEASEGKKIAPLRMKREIFHAPKIPPMQALRFPVASVLVDTGLLHIDDAFDFLVPEEFSSLVAPGVLVSIFFGGKRRQGVVLTRKEESQFTGRLRFLSEVIRPYPVLSSSILDLTGEIKRYYGGTRWDALRFALPQFSKTNEEVSTPTEHELKATPAISRERDEIYPEGFWKALTSSPKDSPQVRAYWSPPPAMDPFNFLESLLSATQGGVILLLPDQSDVERMFARLKASARFDMAEVSIWHSGLKRREREETFVRALNHKTRIVIGVRGALLLPIENLHLIALWDEGNSSYSEQRTPYFHAREVAIMRSRIDKTHLVIGGFAPSLTAAQYLHRGYLTHLSPLSDFIKKQAVTIKAITNRSAPNQSGRFPTIAWQTLRRGLTRGPVIVQAQLRGYIQALSCSRCFNGALCKCGGKLIAKEHIRIPECYLCGTNYHNWICPYCSHRELRNSQIGDERLVEELGRAFPNQLIISSNAEHRVERVSNQAAIVVATPGSEPIALDGYEAGVIIDSRISLERATLNAEEDSRRRWFAFATLLRPGSELFIDCEYTNRNLQALIRWDGLGASLRELQERENLLLPPHAKTVEVRGEHNSVGELIRALPGKVLVSAPKMAENGETVALLRFPMADNHLVLEEIFNRARGQSSRGSHVARVKVDPISF
jgi:primosomal protein N' (replication factor Y)